MSLALTAEKPPVWKRTDILYLGILIALTTLLRVLAQKSLNSPIESDALSYFTMAKNLYEGRGIVDPAGQLAYMNAGYPFFIYLVWKVFGLSVAVVKQSSLLLAAVTLALIYASALLLWGSRFAAIAASLAWAIFFESMNAAGYLYKENLMCPLVILQVFLVVLHGKRRAQMTLAALLGISIGVMALVGNAGLAIVPALLWQLCRQSDQPRQAAYQLTTVLLCALLVVGPWLIRNQLVLGHPVLNTNFGFNLYIGNNANADGRYISILETPLGGPAFQELLRSRGEYETYKYLSDLAKQYMLENPGHTIAIGIKKAFLFWEPPNTASLGSLRENLARWANYSEHWLLLIGFAIFSVWSVRWERRYLFLTAAVALYTAMHMPFYPFPRYRLPIMPIVCLGAGFAAELLLRNIECWWVARKLGWGK